MWGPFALMLLLCCAVIPNAALGMRPLDASTTVSESDWFHAGQYFELLKKHCQKWTGQQRFSCVDVFSHSRRFETQFKKGGLEAASYDIQNNPEHDITTCYGFLVLLDMGLGILGFP